MSEGYTRKQVALHWTIMALVAVQFLFHEAMSDAFDIVMDGRDAGVSALTGLHIFLGFVIFALTLIRLQIRWSDGAPPPPDAEPAPFRTLSKAAHWAFYGLLVALPVSGAVAWFRRNEAAGDVHEVLRALLLALIAMHVAAVLVHQFVWKTDLLSRMLKPVDPKGDGPGR